MIHGEVVIMNNTWLYESGNWNEYDVNPLLRIHWRVEALITANSSYSVIISSIIGEFLHIPNLKKNSAHHSKAFPEQQPTTNNEKGGSRALVNASSENSEWLVMSSVGKLTKILLRVAEQYYWTRIETRSRSPSNVESISDEMVDHYFSKVNDRNWEDLKLPVRSNLPAYAITKL
ncbi:UNVERIFIED_CONTAM: hypothetical protein Sindi_2478400 [Sesamum indicum]